MAVAIPHAAGGRGAGWMLADMCAQDLRDVLEIERRSFANPWTAALFLQELRIPFSRIIVARASAAAPLVGYLCRWLVVDEVHVLNVAVHPEHRRRGLATALMHEALRDARAAGAAALTLEVRRGNVAARGLYERLGFEEIGLRRDYYGRGEDALIMRLAIEHA